MSFQGSRRGRSVNRCCVEPRMMLDCFTMDYQHIISIEPGKRGGRPCIRHMRIAVADVLGWLAAGQTHAQILDDFPELTEDDIRACLAYAADRERRVILVSDTS
jgi:uncharacterized protein (DUF433 family)